MIAEPADDLVVLLDERDLPVGEAPRRSVHTDRTPRHLAFSCYLFDERGRVLLTRRALEKATWPGVWTNSCCGHPRPGETAEDAVRRRVFQELGAGVDGLELVLPDFGYRAVTDRCSVADLHGTILHLLGLDHKKLTYRRNGRDERITDGREAKLLDRLIT